MFADFIGEVRTYRDKVIAHADEHDGVDIPSLTIAINSTIYLYERLRRFPTRTNGS